MQTKFSLDQIREFWTQQAREHGTAPAASWSDRMVIDMEVREIVKRLSDGDRILDIGCANGYSTVQFASQRKAHVRGIDYIAGMIEQARQRLAGLVGQLQGSVEFDLGDVTALEEPSGAYDKVVVVRVIDHQSRRQASAIARPARVRPSAQAGRYAAALRSYGAGVGAPESVSKRVGAGGYSHARIQPIPG